MKHRLLALCLCAVLLLGLAGGVTAESEKTVLRIFETTDIHGYLMSTATGDESTFQYRMAYIAQAVNAARASEEYDDVLLINGGNNYEGTPVSNLLEGSAIRAAFDAMGYDAVTIGNHEFDYGIDTVNCDADGTVASYSLGDIQGDPEIPVLAYNLYYAGTQDRVSFAKDYVILQKGGLRVALIGYISDFSSQVMAAKIAPYEIDDDVNHLIDKIKAVNEAEQPDVTILVAFGGAERLAASLTPDLAALVTGGHNQASNGSYGVAESGVAYLESACYAQGFVSATLTVENGQVTVSDLNETALTGRGADLNLLYDTPENAANLDEKVLAISHAAWDAVKDDMNEELGVITTPVDRTKASDNGATYAGNWITSLMLKGTQEQGTVAAFYNNGGIRTSFEIPEGETERMITAGDVYTINPFCNYWYVYEITGAELKQHLLNAFQNANYGDQMSGLTFTYSQIGEKQEMAPGGMPGGAPGAAPGAAPGGAPGGMPGQQGGDEVQYTILSITLSDGTEVDLEDTQTLYRVCTSNYSGTLAGGVFENKEPIVPAAEAPIDNITIIELLRQESSENGGQLFVDTTPRGTRILEESQGQP